MANKRIVHVVGTGTIGEPLVGLLATLGLPLHRKISPVWFFPLAETTAFSVASSTRR